MARPSSAKTIAHNWYLIENLYRQVFVGLLIFYRHLAYCLGSSGDASIC